MSFNKKFQDYLPSLLLVILMMLVVGIYCPGLQGGFLFDDDPNLQELGTYGGVVDFETFKSFVFTGISSSLGRPLSLATFLLDDNTWPSHAEGFKVTNLKIHLLTGLFLCWASLNLMRLLGRSENEAVWIALLNCAIWMLHPYMVSTTLYVIQRMAQLAALFIFSGMTAYLYGRLQIVYGRIKSGYLWMSFSLIVCTLLGLLSKENGILLVLLVLLIESCLPSSVPKLYWQWRLLFLGLPSLLIIAAILSKIEIGTAPWINRPFNQWERVLTEPRILWEYLYHLYAPRIEGRGLFQDGYSFSRSLLHPITTLTSIIGLIVSIAVAIKYRKRFPIPCLAILFFLTSHLLESTWLNLELYFEHRNYASSAFLFLPLAVGLVQLNRIIDYRLAIFCCILVLLLLAFLTWKRSNLWSNTNRLQYYWAASTPESVRAQNQITQVLLAHRKMDAAVKHLEDSVEKFNTSGFLTINLLYLKIHLGRAQEADFISAGERLVYQPFDAQALSSLRKMVDDLADTEIDITYARYTIKLLENIYSNESYKNSYIFKKLYFYFKGRLYLRLKEYSNALENYKTAMAMYSETDAALSMVAEVANRNRPHEALILLDQAEQIYKLQPTMSLKRSRNVYDKEFVRMRLTLEALEKYNHENDSIPRAE